MKMIAFIITVYKNDSLSYFKKSIESIVNQTYDFQNINIYLGIDGSLSKETRNYIEVNSSLFYKIIKNQENKGLAYTLNRLIESLENEEFIFRMDSDDICRKDRVSKQISFLTNNPEILLLGSDLIEMDENENELRHKSMPSSHEDIIHYSIARNPFNHPTIVLKKDFFNIVGLYNETILKSQDYELWARALKKGIPCTNINEPLLYFRIASDYMKKRNSLVNYINELKISIDLVFHFRKYSQIPKVLIKFIVRILPSKIGEYVYKKIRN